jgi:hypothetical protein
MLKADVIKHFGALESIAQALNISKSAVSQWGKVVPEGTAYKLQVITGGRLQVIPSLYHSASQHSEAN